MKGETPSALAATVLLCCVATSALTTLVIHLYLHSKSDSSNSVPSSQSLASKSAFKKVSNKQEATIPAHRVNGSSGNKSIIDLQTLPDSDIPVAFQLDAYFSPDKLKEFDHARLFDGCSNVLAVLDAIHPYLEKFFADNAWMSTSTAENTQTTTLQSSTRLDSDGRGLAEEESDSEDSDDPRPAVRGRSSSYPRVKTRWRLPEWLDPNETAEIVIYPGVRTQTFAPVKVINLEEDGRGRPARRPSTESAGSARRPYGWSRSAVSQEDEEEVEKRRLIVLPNAHVLGGTFDLSEGSIHIGKHVRIEPNVFIKGPAIIGARSTLRSGTYIRGDVIVGQNVVLRGEIKNSVILDDAELCHPGYCGDSVCGFKSHFGNQVTTANLSLLTGSNLTLDVDGVTYDTGRKKMGVILGDGSQLGCSSVTDPCTLIQQNTVVYPLTRLRKGIYGSSLIIKNKPMEKGVVEVIPLRGSLSDFRQLLQVLRLLKIMGNVVGCFKTNKQDAATSVMGSEECQDEAFHTTNEAQVEIPTEPSRMDRVDEKPEEEAYAQVDLNDQVAHSNAEETPETKKSRAAMTITKRVQKELVQAAPPADTQLLQKLRKNSHALQRAHKAANKNKGKAWTREEHERFLVALDAFPSGPWKAIADFVGTKDSRQTMTHAQKYRQKHERQQRGLRNRNKGKKAKQTVKPAALDTADSEADVMMAEVTNFSVVETQSDNRDPFAPAVDESLFSMALDAGAAWLGAKTDSDLMEIFAECNEPVTDAAWPQMWSTNSLEEIVASCSQLDFLA